MSNALVCAVQVRIIIEHVNAVGIIIRAYPRAQHDLTHVLHMVTELMYKPTLTAFLPLRTALLRLLLALEHCAELALWLPMYEARCTSILTAFADKEYYAHGWTDYACARVQLVQLLARHWPRSAQPFMFHVHNAQTTCNNSCTSEAKPVLEQNLICKK